MFHARLAEWNRLGRPFRLLLASDTLMLLSMMVGHVAVPWWIAHEGGAGHLALYASLLAAVSFFALPLLSPLGDRVSKRVLITVGLAAMLVVMIFFVPGIGMLVPLKVQSLGLSGAWLGACEAGSPSAC